MKATCLLNSWFHEIFLTKKFVKATCLLNSWFHEILFWARVNFVFFNSVQKMFLWKAKGYLERTHFLIFFSWNQYIPFKWPFFISYFSTFLDGCTFSFYFWNGTLLEMFSTFLFSECKKFSCMLFFCFSFSCFFYLFIIDSDDDDDKASFGNNGTMPYFLCLNFWNSFFSVFFMLLRFVYAVSICLFLAFLVSFFTYLYFFSRTNSSIFQKYFWKYFSI